VTGRRSLGFALSLLIGFAIARFGGTVGIIVVAGLAVVGAGVYAGLQNRRELERERRDRQELR
jgi:hypothetical protein